MAPTSRTPSTLSMPKASKRRPGSPSPLSHETQDSSSKASSPTVNYVGPQFSDDAMFVESPPRKSPKDNSKSKHKKKEKDLAKRRKKQNTWLDLFSRMFILGFLIYSLSVCPNAKDESAICRGLAEYKRLILEPYVITPFVNLLQHPSVSPYSAPVIENARPVLERSRKEWDTRIVPQWKKHIVPQWNARVSPHIAVLDEKIDPYRRKVTEAYTKHVDPYVVYIRRAARKSQPYVVMSAAKTYDAYQFSKPYIARAYKEAQRVPPFIMKYIIRPLAAIRRQYVDPHAFKLYEKTKDVIIDKMTSLGFEAPIQLISTISKAVEGVTGSVNVPSHASKEAIASAASNVSASLHTRSQSSSVILSSSSIASESTPASAASVIKASRTLGDEPTESVPGATYSPEPEELISKSEPKEEPKTVYFTERTKITSTIVVHETATATSHQTPNDEAEAEEDAPVEAPKAHRPPNSVSGSAPLDKELEDLLADLGLDLEETVSLQPSPVPPPVIEETEEEKAAKEAARLAEVAEKRRELQARHSQWEEKLANAIAQQTSELKSAIAEIRRAAATDLKANLAIRETVDKLHNESEKALRGTEAYFTKLKEGGKSLEEQSKLWDRVLKKVEGKFEERIMEVEEKVNKWYQDEVLSKEEQTVVKGSGIVRSIADDAQADIGLDYAWLDDVTYMDWRRYHALIDKHQIWLDEANMLINGSHQTPIPNPVLDALEDLQSEVRDITLGFETRMRRVKREGERTFSGDREEEPVPNHEVSALPIETKEDEVLQEVADAIMSRGEKEIVDALGRAEKYNHEEL